MRVPPEQTQAPADELVSYDDFLLRLDQLSSSPRVRVRKLGESHGGRGLYVILLTGEDAMGRLEHHRVRSTALHLPDVVHKSLSEIEMAERPAPDGDVRFPALITGLSFGHEASHVEAHLALAERLAWGDDDEVKAILSKLVVLIMPMINPDGRDMSIDIWRRYPLAEDSSAGNLYGFYLNRDFLHLTQPETRAVARVYKEWHPIALLDTHEDVFSLGVQMPDACWCPYSGHAPVEKAPPHVLQLITQLAEAIRQEWESHGFQPLERNMFAHPMPGEPEEGPHWIASGNVVETMALHGLPSVITESGRTPGVQPWDDRIQQKYLAGMALLKEVAKQPESLVDAMYAYRKDAIQQAHQTSDSFLVRKNQKEQGAVHTAVDNLLQQGIKVYETAEPYSAYVVPLAQGEPDVARTLLSTQSSKLAAMAPALGISITPYDALSKSEQSTLKNAELTPVMAPPTPTAAVVRETDTVGYAVPNTTEGIMLVNRLWGLGSPVQCLAQAADLGEERLAAGTFFVSETSEEALSMLAQGLALDLWTMPGDLKTEVYSLRRPRVALYVGQGVDTPNASARGDIWWALDSLGFGFAPLVADDIRGGILETYDILIVPGGDAQEIIYGWNPEAPLNAPPWELPGVPRGIGHEGLDALRQYVEAGGHYLGVASGGGLLASSQYTNLVDLEVMAHSLGTTRVLLRVNDNNHPLLFGLDGYHDEDGEWVDGYFPAQYHSETFTDTPGGPIFKARKDCMVLATYSRPEHDPESLQVIEESYLTEAEEGVAIATQRVGEGQASVVGVCPGFRALWTNTWKLISNAIFLAVADD